MPENEVRATLSEWLENPSWREVYDESPSSACRKYLAMLFYANDTETDEAYAELDALEADLSRDDCEYLYSVMEGPERAKWARKIAER